MQDIENSLNRAMSAMRRTSKKKRKTEISSQNGESFSEIIENIATERAEEELYRARYRRRLEEDDVIEESAPEEEVTPEEIPSQEEVIAVEEPVIEEPQVAGESAPEEEVTPEAIPSQEEVIAVEAPVIEEPQVAEESAPEEEVTPEEIPSQEEVIAVEEPVIEEPQVAEESAPEEEVTPEEIPTIDEGNSEANASVGAYNGQMPIGYYIVPGVAPVYPTYTSYGMPEGVPAYIPTNGQAQGGVSTFMPPMTDSDGYIPPDLSGGEGAEFPIDTYQPDGEVNMPTQDDGYIGDIDYGDNPPDNIDYGAPEVDALPPDNIDYGAYTDPHNGDEEIELPVDLGGYPDEILYPEMTDISEGVHATDEGTAYFIADRVDENVKLVEMRMLYEIAEYKLKHKMSTLSFSLEFGREYRNERELYREVNKRINKMRRAIRLERDSNRRYYLVLSDRCIADPVRREKNRARIESVIRRIDFLLTERQKINNRLLELYAGDVTEDKKPLAEKIGKKATRVAKRVYRSMKKLAKRVSRMHAPDELREKIFDLMNERITEYSRRTQLEESLRRLKPRGDARRRMKKEYRECCRRIRYMNSDLKKFVKKAERYDTIYYENGKQLAWIFGTLITLGVLCGLYFANKEAIDAFILGLFGGV